MSGSMPEDGDGTDRVGFLFWQTKSGYKFKSIDTMISDSKKETVFEYVQNDATSDNPNFDLYNPTFEIDQNIILQMMNSMYGENRKYFNLHTLQVTDDVAFSKTNAKQAHLGTEDEVTLNYDISENPSVPTRNVLMDYTMRKDGTINEGDKEYNPHKIISQAKMRYQTLLSRSLRATVPMNLKLEAGDVINVKLIDSMTVSSSTINVGAANTSYFANYEGISTASAGYAKIGQEIIYYSSVDADGTLGIGTRGIDNTIAQPHAVDSLVYKYELNGASLIGINTTHDMTAELNAYQDIDKFYLSAGRGVRQTGDTQLSFTNQKTTGGTNIFVSKNFQYNSILPIFNVLTPGETTGLSAQLRSVSGTSAGGSEISFIDQGYENVELNQLNKLSSTRLICSEVNELEHLSNLPKNRSTTLAVQFTSEDPNLSPMLDLQNGTLILQRNKFNKPVSDYSNDSRSNETSGDPHASIYISNRINLKQPASSLKVLVSAFRHSSADFRVLYQLFRPDSSEVEQTYELFPGFNNLTDTDDDGFGDTIIDVSLNNGRSDAFVTSSKNDEFKEYQFSVDELESFTGFKIKIVSSGTDEANSTRFKDLRVIALA